MAFYAIISATLELMELVMSNVLKGNYETKKTVAVKDAQDETLEQRFERDALKRLGGSIAFVAKKKVTWSADDEQK